MYRYCELPAYSVDRFSQGAFDGCSGAYPGGWRHADPAAPTFTDLETGSTALLAYGITRNGQIVGTYLASPGGPEQGFVDFRGEVTTFNPGGGQYTWPLSTSESGALTGRGSTASGSLFGYSYARGKFQVISVPGAANTEPHGINDRGEVVGTYTTPGGLEEREQKGFIYEDGQVTVLTAPGGGAVTPNDVNNSGEVVGTYVVDGQSHGFIYLHGRYTTLDVPGATNTTPTGINSQGDVVGYYQDASFVYHGFLEHDGRFTTIDDPKADYATWPEDINDRGEIVGVYVNTTTGSHGFLLA
jgi:probable HAF family extracellular repeat protein